MTIFIKDWGKKERKKEKKMGVTKDGVGGGEGQLWIFVSSLILENLNAFLYGEVSWIDKVSFNVGISWFHFQSG